MIDLSARNPVNLFAQLALPQAQLMQAASQIPPFALPALHSAYSSAASALPQFPGPFVPPFLSMPSPASMCNVMRPLCGGGYAERQTVDLAAGSPNNALARIFNPERREAGRMEAALRSDPFARHAFEHAIGGRIVDFGTKDDGRFTVERGAHGHAHPPAISGGNPMASSIAGLLAQMNGGVLSQLGSLAAGGLGGAAAGGLAGAALGNPFLGLALGGLGGIASQLVGAQRPGLGALAPALGGLGGGGGIGGGGPTSFAGFDGGVQGFPLFGTGSASWNPLAQPGKIQGSNKAYEGAHSAQVGSILNDPSLTMEDKIMLAMMMICSKLDEDIKRQTEYLNQLQNQQGTRGGQKAGGLGGKLGGAAGAALGGPVGAKLGGGIGNKLGGGGQQDGEKTIDLETKKMERMMQKRGQLFDTMSKLMERYDQSAKNVIQSMRG